MKARTLAALAAVALSAQSLPAQDRNFDPAQTAMQISEKRKANQEMLKAYSWHSRTEVMIKGQIKNVKTEIVRYTLDGELQRTPVKDQDPKKQPKKKQRAWKEELDVMIERYRLPSAGKVLDYLNKATIAPDSQNGFIRVRGYNVVQPGDELSWWVEPGSRQLTRIKITTRLQGDTVIMEHTYKLLENGPLIIDRTVVRVPVKQVVMTVENFKHQKQ